MIRQGIVRRFAAWTLAVALVASAAHGETTTSENGYEVRHSQTLVPVPHGKVGRKTIDRETRTGTTEETDGNSLNFTMTLGGFMNRCPVPEGTPVKFAASGDFEYSVVFDTVDTDVVPTERRHYEKRMTARIKVFVNDDLSVTEGEIDGEFSSNIDGVRTGPVRLHKRFPIRAYGTPDFDALLEAVAVTGDMAAAALMWNASTTILAAQKEWREPPNACAQLDFDPPSETRAVAPGETVEIRVKYRTRDGQLPIPKGIWDAAAVQGGQVPEATGPVKPDGTFVVRYVARSSSSPKDGDGARIEALSAAGYARDIWKIRALTKFEGTFTQRQQMSVTPQQFAGYGVVVTIDFKADGRLVWTPDTDSARAPTFGEVTSKFYAPTDGEITVKVDNVAGKSIAGSCVYEGSQTFPIRSLPPAALKHLVLEIAADGRYRLRLGMISEYLEFQATRNCSFRAAPGFPLPVAGGGGTEVMDAAAIALGKQEGQIVDDVIAGRTAAPIKYGAHTFTGEWQFKKSRPAQP